MLHQTFLLLGQLWQLFEVSQILEFLRYIPRARLSLPSSHHQWSVSDKCLQNKILAHDVKQMGELTTFIRSTNTCSYSFIKPIYNLTLHWIKLHQLVM